MLQNNRKMDDILVFILTLIFIIAGIFGQTKKKPQQRQSAGETPPPDHPVWRSLGFDDDEQEPVGVTDHVTIPEEGGRGDRFHSQSSMMTRQFAPKVMPETRGMKTTGKRKRKSFPLKQAIIYSEILNRKYF